MSNTLYMKCTTDKYELPLAVEDSPAKLAKRLGLKRHSVATLCSKQICGYHRVKVEPEMWPDNDGNLWYYNEQGENCDSEGLTMKVGDTIQCRDKFDMVDNMMQLAKNDIETEFVYEKDGVKGFWLEVVKVKYDG